MTRRTTELLLLLLAAPLVILLYAMIVMNQGVALDVNTLGVPLGLFGAFTLAHLAVRKWAPEADPALLPLCFALAGIGIAFVTRLAPELAVRQVIWLFASIAFMILVLAIAKNIDKVASYKYTLMVAGFLLLLSPMLPFVGQEIYGSRIWLDIAGFSFQPGEVAKVLIVLFLAGYLASHREMLSIFTINAGPFHLPDIRTLLPLLLMWGISLVIVIFEKDLGSALVVFFVFISMLYVASGKKSYVVFALVLASLGAFAMWGIFSHVQVRVSTWLDPFADAEGAGYQLTQAIYSMADGNLFGVGIGKGMCDLIPVVESDFIFAAIAEETGLLGAAGVLLLYLCFAIRGLVSAARAKSDVSSFIAVGLTTTIVLQAFIIVGGVTRLIPLTGLTLPFISQGGSSLLASFISVGLLLACGNEGTGVGAEITTSNIGAQDAQNSVLGRVALGKRITNLMIAFSILFAALVANLTFIMVVQADHYRNLASNSHTLERQATRERGTISTADGVILAQSVQNEDGTFSRVYPSGTLASHVVGYYSSRFGASGIEASMADTLQGNDHFASWKDVLYSYAGLSTGGNDVELTIDSRIQYAAQEALSGYNGACVVLNPETGAILAMASAPTYDAAGFEYLLAQDQETDALFNRATQALYAPGSTFKMLTLATALDNNIASETSTYESPGSLEIGNATVYNYDEKDLGTISLAEATKWSSNTVFGQVGVEIGPELLVRSAEEFGFNRPLNINIASAQSLMPKPEEMTEWETAWSAIGQPVGEHESPAGPQASVLEMALIGSAIANDGVIQTPYLVERVYNNTGAVASSTSPSVLSKPISASSARRTKDVLQSVVESGTGMGARIWGVNIAGKTGTAETGRALDDSWFVGFGPTEDCKVVVALVLEEGADGTTDAATRANNVLYTALDVQKAL